MRAVHDMGGNLDSRFAGPVDTSEHDRSDWEKRVDAMGVLLRRPEVAFIGLDQLRRNGEALAESYLRTEYGERTLHSMVQTLIQRGAITIGELTAKLDEIAQRETP
jgi:Nitrile hydratase beta subunit